MPDSACLNANAICSSVKCFFPIQKPTLSGDVKGKKPNIPAGSINGENVTLRGVEGFQSGVFYPAPSTMNCSDCGYRKACRAWAR